MKYCEQCGTQLKETANFCSVCGNSCSTTRKKVLICKKCGTQLDNDDLFCPECGEPYCTLDEFENKLHSQQVPQKPTEQNSSTKYNLVYILLAISFFAILALPIVNCESDWIDALSGGAATITFADTLDDIRKNGIDALNDIDVMIGLTAFITPILLFAGAIAKSNGAVCFFSGMASLIMLLQLFCFQDAISELYYFSDYFTLYLGFWIPFISFVICFFYSLSLPENEASDEE